MLVIFLAVFAVVVQNSDSDCELEFQNVLDVCEKKYMDPKKEVIEMSNTEAQKKKICCAYENYETCAMDGIKECGESIEAEMKRLLEMSKEYSMMTFLCSGSYCNGGNSGVRTNSVSVCLLLFLGYFLYVNKF